MRPLICGILAPRISFRRSASTLHPTRLIAEQTRAIYRDIFRQSSYLPDQLIRHWSRQHARHRFRRSLALLTPINGDERGINDHNPKLNATRVQDALRDARNFANTLRRAIAGERRPLIGLVEAAYGTRGRRRRELLQPLLHNATAAQKSAWVKRVVSRGIKSSTEEFDAAIELLHIDPHGAQVKREKSRRVLPSLGQKSQIKADSPSSLSSSPSPPVITAISPSIDDHASRAAFPPLTTALGLLAQSQMQHQHLFRSSIQSSALRRIRPVIPELNAWMRPMPRVRVKNLLKQGYANFLAKVQSPLGFAEWERLHGLASGRINLVVPPRRSPSRIDQDRDRGSTSDQIDVDRSTSSLVLNVPPSTKLDTHLEHRTTNDGRQTRNQTQALEMIMRKPRPDPARAFCSRDAHTLTPRYLQRLYQTVFAGCPRFQFDQETKKYTVIWGHQVLK